MVSEDDVDKMRPYAPILERMVDLLGGEERLTFGQAMERASRECGFGTLRLPGGGVWIRPEVPEHVKNALLRAGFKVHMNGFPGAATA